MSGFSLTVVIVSMVGSGLTTVLSVRAAIKLTSWAGSPWLRLALVISALQSTTYFVSYWWLLNHTDSGASWSEALRPIGALAWWIGPWPLFPLALEFHLKKRAKAMKAQAARMLEGVKREISPSDE